MAFVSTQALPHSVSALGQAGTHAPPTQLVLPPVGAPHTLVHVPQCAESVFRSKQSSPHLLKPDLQATLHAPPLQTGDP